MKFITVSSSILGSVRGNIISLDAEKVWSANDTQQEFELPFGIFISGIKFDVNGTSISPRQYINPAGLDQFVITDPLYCVEGSRNVTCPNKLSAQGMPIDAVQNRGFKTKSIERIGGTADTYIIPSEDATLTVDGHVGKTAFGATYLLTKETKLADGGTPIDNYFGEQGFGCGNISSTNQSSLGSLPLVGWLYTSKAVSEPRFSWSDKDNKVNIGDIDVSGMDSVKVTGPLKDIPGVDTWCFLADLEVVKAKVVGLNGAQKTDQTVCANMAGNTMVPPAVFNATKAWVETWAKLLNLEPLSNETTGLKQDEIQYYPVPSGNEVWSKALDLSILKVSILDSVTGKKVSQSIQLKHIISYSKSRKYWTVAVGPNPFVPEEYIFSLQALEVFNVVFEYPKTESVPPKMYFAPNSAAIQSTWALCLLTIFYTM